MVILRAEGLAVGGVEGVGLRHLLPADEIFHGAGITAVAVEGDVQEEALRTEAFDIQRDKVVHFVHGQPHVEGLDLPVVGKYHDGGQVFPVLYGEQQVTVAHRDALVGVVLSKLLRILGKGCGGRQESRRKSGSQDGC